VNQVQHGGGALDLPAGRPSDEVSSESEVGMNDPTNTPMMPPAPLVGIAAVTENMLKHRWSNVILRYSERGVTDPAEIVNREPELTQSIITERLRAMLRYGLLARFPRPHPSTVIEYRLTSRGRSVLRMLDLIDELDQKEGRSRPVARDVPADPIPERSTAAVNPPSPAPASKGKRPLPSKSSSQSPNRSSS
jgi:DNA-binding HxlR family transcriptional regulator